MFNLAKKKRNIFVREDKDLGSYNFNYNFFNSIYMLFLGLLGYLYIFLKVVFYYTEISFYFLISI